MILIVNKLDLLAINYFLKRVTMDLLFRAVGAGLQHASLQLCI